MYMDKNFLKHLFKDLKISCFTRLINYYQLYSLLNSYVPRIILAWS